MIFLKGLIWFDLAGPAEMFAGGARIAFAMHLRAVASGKK
jgi:hypothetical protein